MVKTLQKKFIVTAMIAVTVLLAVLLGAINAANVVSASGQTSELLDMLSRQEDFGPAPHWEQAGEPEREPGNFFRRPLNENDRMTALTFSVRFDAEEQLLGANLDRIAGYTEEEAEALGRQALAAGKETGRIGDLKYKIVEPAEGFRTVVFLDVSAQRYDLLRVAALSALVGVAAWLAMLALVALLSRRAIRPIAENMERQRRFVTDAGHELKTPVAIILANLDAMELMGGESKYSRNIRAQAGRLSGLTRNLLTLARADEAGKSAAFAPVSLSELTQESWEMFREPAALKKLDCRADIAPEVTVSASRDQLGQLLSILLDNAVKYCPEGGSLSLSLRKEDKAVLRVRNSLGGEKPDTDRLFDRFYRADSSRSQKTGGYGIGLSAAQAIVRQHKGSITAAVEGDEIVFTVRLPLG